MSWRGSPTAGLLLPCAEVLPLDGRFSPAAALAALDCDPAGEALDGTARGRLGNVLAPQGLALRRLPTKLLAVTGPLDALVLASAGLARYDSGRNTCPGPRVPRRALFFSGISMPCPEHNATRLWNACGLLVHNR